MAMVAEALGLTVPNSAMVPGVYSERLAIAKRAGEIVMEILKRGGPLPRDLGSGRAARTGKRQRHRGGDRRLDQRGAAHSGDRHEAGIRFTVDDVAAVFARTPLIGDLRPGGKYLAKDVHEIGGVSVIIRALIESGHIDGDCLTVTGRTLTEEHGSAPPLTAKSRARPAMRAPGWRACGAGRGNLAPVALPQGRRTEGTRLEGIARAS